MRRAHVEAGAYVVQATTKVPPADARVALRLRRGQQVHEVIRVRSANGDPITLEEGYFPADVFPEMLRFDLHDSLYRVMEREYGMAPFSADEVIEPVKATAQQAELLHVPVESSLLLVTRTSYAADGSPVEFSRDFFRPDRTRIMLRTQADHGPGTRLSTEPVRSGSPGAVP
jgi:GntR family transcriptional regulator